MDRLFLANKRPREKTQMEKKNIIEKVALVFGVSIVIVAMWFWSGQVGDVLEVLEMAYG
jgi:hypothetical protein